MVLFVMGFVGLSVWAVVVDTLGPVVLRGSDAASIGCFALACIFPWLRYASRVNYMSHTCEPYLREGKYGLNAEFSISCQHWVWSWILKLSLQLDVGCSNIDLKKDIVAFVSGAASCDCICKPSSPRSSCWYGATPLLSALFLAMSPAGWLPFADEEVNWSDRHASDKMKLDAAWCIYPCKV